ncbi:MAG: hypothetical protein S4CHLAM2_13560 [Chlamydiales bacterium]|nr:hypothetical protein [Chlamydiales bacterium]
MKLTFFWNRHPALLYGLTLLLSTLFVLQTPYAALPLLLFLDKKNVGIVTLLFLLPIAYLYQAYTFPPSGTPLKGTFTIQSITENKGFTPGWTYRGHLKTKEGRLQCQLRSQERHKANCAYQISGLAFTQNERFYYIKPFQWEPVPYTFSLAEIRYHAKKWVKHYIERKVKGARAAQFLIGMVTGGLEDPVMLQAFGNLGLSHIMAISGFHFALLTLALHLILRLILPPKPEAWLLMGALTLYLLFIGESPSVQRAWIVAMVFLLGRLIERPPNPLNSLGVALCLIIALNPLSAITLSFQLSFLATGGILLFYKPLHHLLLLWIPKYPLQEAIERSLLWQQGYFFAVLIREALALTLSVHLTLLPLLLTFFHTFSLNSLIYNLFFPFCASLALFLFLLGIFTGGLLHPLNSWYCEHLLTLTESPPLLFKTFYIENIPNLFTIIYIISLFIILICYNYYYDKTHRRDTFW